MIDDIITGLFLAVALWRQFVLPSYSSSRYVRCRLVNGVVKCVSRPAYCRYLPWLCRQ